MLPSRNPLAALLVAIVLLVLPACGSAGGTPFGGGGGPSEVESGPVSGTVYIWMGASKDALVSCGRPASGCPEANNNYGLMGFLTVAGWQQAIKGAYVYFDLPLLPDGTVIEEAYFEMYHGGQNEDGNTDDVLIPVAEAAGPWSPWTITYANQPNPTPGAGVTSLNLTSMDWSGTPNIVGIIRSWRMNPNSNYGLVASWSPQRAPYIEKGFYSINDRSRTNTELGLAPRLLLKVQLPDGTTSNDIMLPTFLPPDHDLPTVPGEPIMMMRTAGGPAWPASWEVRQGL